jgi:serine O-acetyltransferase
VILALSALELVVVWLVPVAVLVGLWLVASLAVYAMLLGPSTSDFKADLVQKFEGKRRLRSGQRVRLSYLAVAKLLIGDNCVQATLFYRLGRFCIRRRLRGMAEALHSLSKLLTNVDISPHADIGPGLYIYHGMGTVIGKGTRMGRRVIVCQNVTTGGGPTIGDDVRLWAGAKVIGKMAVGDRAEVGANAVVVHDIPADYIAVGVPATRLIPKGGESRPEAQRVAER